jgi:hypothetical protein
MATIPIRSSACSYFCEEEQSFLYLSILPGIVVLGILLSGLVDLPSWCDADVNHGLSLLCSLIATDVADIIFRPSLLTS